MKTLRRTASIIIPAIAVVVAKPIIFDSTTAAAYAILTFIACACFIWVAATWRTGNKPLIIIWEEG
jgi:hypothetical protein